jgi:polysaccharide export outer membrane protein
MSVLGTFERVHVAIFLLPILAGAFAIPSRAQQATTTESHTNSPDAIGPDDLIDLTVAYCPELTHNFRVSSDGKLALPLLHQPLDVAGTSPSQLSLRIETALKDAHVLVDPVVSVSVLESRSRPVSVVGAVNHPLTFQATTRTTLIDAIARAQGISPTAGGTIVLTSPGPGDSSTVREIPVATLLDGKAPRDNVSLRGGEEIRVLEGNKIFVAGDVRRPGMYPMQSDSDTTVVKALALSSGLDQYSAKIAYIYRRSSGDKQREEIQVPLKAILKRRAPDVELKADDILFIPTNNGERITGKLLSQLAGFGQTAEAGLLVIH